jgi:hypothetical protein
MFNQKIALGITAGLLGAFALVGAAFAQEGSVNDKKPRDSIKDRVAEILDIDRESLDTAMSTARTEHRKASQKERLEALVEAETITQAQSDEIEVWQDSKPEIMDDLMNLGRSNGRAATEASKLDFQHSLSRKSYHRLKPTKYLLGPNPSPTFYTISVKS